jgi:hypothetical protein
MQHLAADIEVLIYHKHAQTGITRPDGAGQSGSSRTNDHKVSLVIPLDAVGSLRGRLGYAATEGSRTDTSDRTVLEEISPADGLVVLRLPSMRTCVTFPGHAFLPCSQHPRCSTSGANSKTDFG